MYCETPDLGRSKGWAGIGAVNRGRLAQFHEYMAKRPSDSLRTLIADNKRLRDLNQTVDAYAEAWALTYFLLKQHPKQYVAYMKTLSKKQPLVNDDVPARIAEFEKQFGPLEKLDADFVRYMSGRLH